MPQKTKKTLPPSPRPFVKGGKGPLHPPSFPSYLLLFLPNLPSPPPMAAALPSMDRLDAARALLGVVGPACLNNAAQGTSGQEFEGTPGGLAEHYGDKLPSASDVEEDVLAGKARVAPNAEARGRRRAEAALKIPAIRGLERTAVSIFSRRASSRGALACLVGKRAAFYLSRPEMSIGRSTKYQIVDVDLSPEGDCSKVSRQQGMVRLHPGGSFYFQNLGQRKAKVDGNAVPTRARAVLKNGSLLQVGGLSLMFLVNPLRRD